MSRTLVESVRARASEQPDTVCMSFLQDGERQRVAMTTLDLDRAAGRIAARLRARHARGARALLLLEPGLDYLTAFFGCVYAGVVAVTAYPPSTVRNGRSVARLQAIAADSEASAVLTSSASARNRDVLAEHAPQLAGADWIFTDALEEADYFACNQVVSEDLALLQYTSGSTSQPKGVALSQANLVANVRTIASRMGLSQQSVGVSWLPLFHDMGLIGGALTPLLTGFPITLLSPAHFLQRPARWLEALSNERATVSGAPNFALDLCVERVDDALIEQLDLSSVRVLFSGSEPIRAETLKQFAKRFARARFAHTALYPCYGLAESTLMVTGSSSPSGPRELELDAAQLGQGRVVLTQGGKSVISCGRPDAAHTVKIVHPERLNECASGSVGEIWVRGPSVARGYWNRPDLSRQTFGAALAGGTESYLRTGDLGFIVDAELYVVGRLKEVMIVRGRKLHPQDIEHSVERELVDIVPGGVAAFALDEEHGSQIAVVAEVRRSAALPYPDLLAIMRRLVSDACDVSLDHVALVRRRSLPKTSSGKLQRAACRHALQYGDLPILAEWRSAARSADAEPRVSS